MEAMAADWGRPVRELRVDGGAAANDWLMQFQADVAAIPVGRPAMFETTALGAAALAGLSTGYWSEPDELRDVQKLDRGFEPRLSEGEREELLRGWRRAVRAAAAWAEG
jgi:glycerol kinase